MCKCIGMHMYMFLYSNLIFGYMLVLLEPEHFFCMNSSWYEKHLLMRILRSVESSVKYESCYKSGPISNLVGQTQPSLKCRVLCSEAEGEHGTSLAVQFASTSSRLQLKRGLFSHLVRHFLPSLRKVIWFLIDFN